jgi:hypothetical protein
MSFTKAFALASCLGLAAMMPLSADQWNKKTILTVNEPIQVPGKVLPPGKYVMRLMDSPSNRHIVQIFDGDERNLQTTILAIPNYRLQPTGETQFGWWETPAGQPKALRSWFYPGDNFGQEFAYPKNEATTIASTNNANVPVTYAERESELGTARVGTVDRAGSEQELDRSTYSGSTTTAQQQTDTSSQQTMQQQTTQQQTQQTEMAQATPQQQTMPQATAQQQNMSRQTQAQDQGMAQRTAPARDELPSTASPFPAIGLVGLAAFGLAGALRLRRG